MAKYLYQRVVQDFQGNIISGAAVTVKITGTDTNAQLYSDAAGLNPITQPAYTNANGQALFYVDAGLYDIEASKGLQVAPKLVGVDVGFSTEAGINANQAATDANSAASTAGAAAAYANLAASEANAAASNANYKGLWSDFSGPASPPASYYNNGSNWQLLKPIAAIESVEPVEGEYWHELGDVTKTKLESSEQSLIGGAAKLFKDVAVGKDIPTGTTHLGLENFIMRMSPQTSGSITAINRNTAGAVISVEAGGAEALLSRLENYSQYTVYPSLSVGDSLKLAHDAVEIDGVLYPLSRSLNANVSSINTTTVPYHLDFDGGEKVYLLDARHHMKHVYNVKAFWAKGDGVQRDNPCFQSAVDEAGKRGGYAVYAPTPDVKYKFSRLLAEANFACVWIGSDNVTIFGDGASSEIQLTENPDVAFHFSTEKDLTIQPTGEPVVGFEVYQINVRGTKVYENLPLAFGRGILFRNAKNVNVRNCWVYDMSMIGICSEGGDGYFNVQSNQIHDCRYTAINYNGRCYQSIIAGNICSGSNGDPNSLAIQATGHCVIYGNTVFGTTSYADMVNCGGIAWGEGNYDGIGSIVNNLVKGVAWGIQAVYHGSCIIEANTVINAVSRGGIIMTGTTTPSFTVRNSDNLCSMNQIINCAPYGITCSAPNTQLIGNRVRTFSPVTNPSANTEPDYIFEVNTAQGIRIRAEGCDVQINRVRGCTHGLTTTILQDNGLIGGNNLAGNTHAYSLESETSGVFASFGHAVIEREFASPNNYRERIFRAALPAQGYFSQGSQWSDPTPQIGQPTGQIVLWADKSKTIDTEYPSGTTVMNLNDASTWLGTGTGSVVGVELDNGAWHWTTLTSRNVNEITIGTAIPSGRSVLAGANTTYNFWRPLAVLA